MADPYIRNTTPNPSTWNTRDSYNISPSFSWTKCTPTSDTSDTSDTNDTSKTLIPSYLGYRGFRRIYVTHPKHWNKKQNNAFLLLVNVETQTGWKARFLKKGEKIPKNAERMNMGQFIPEFKKNASTDDINIINKFFKKNPVWNETKSWKRKKLYGNI